jgi:Protein of unknown function (DUF402)
MAAHTSFGSSWFDHAVESGGRRRRGEVVALREIWKGRVWKARPYIVVHDRPDQLALFLPQGTPTKIPAGDSGIPRDHWTLRDGVFEHTALRLAEPGRAHSVLLFWDEGGFKCWYVNLERPLRRSAVGFDYLDQELDVVVERDRSWHFLDEDEFERAQQVGVLSPEEAAAVRAEADGVIRRIERWGPPFCDGWETWQADPGWPKPELPQGWEVVGRPE